MILRINKVNPSVLSVSKGGREKGTKRNTFTVRNYKRRTRKNTLQPKKSRETIEFRKQHIKNLSDTQLTTEQINLLSRGLKFIPTPVMKENQIRRQLTQTSTNLPEGCAFNIYISWQKYWATSISREIQLDSTDSTVSCSWDLLRRSQNKACRSSTGSLLAEVSDGEKEERPLPAPDESSVTHALGFPSNELHFSHM